MAGYYVVKVRSFYALDFSNPAFNIFTYSTTETAETQVGAETLLDLVKGQFFGDGQWQDCVNTATLTGDIEITAPRVPSVLVVDSESFPGNTVGQYLPPFNAASFFSPRTRGDVRQGKKRIGLISEANQINGIWEATFEPFLAVLAGSFQTSFLEPVSGTDQTFTPVVVKRIPYTAPSGRTAYRLPVTGDALTMATATNWDYSARVTTQNSRKR